VFNLLNDILTYMESAPQARFSKDVPLPLEDESLFLGDGIFTIAHESLIDSNYVVKTYNSPTDPEEAKLIYEETKDSYRKLRNIFGDAIPESVFTLSENPRRPGNTHVKIVQDRVFKAEDMHVGKEEIGQFIQKCIDHYVSTYNPETQKGEAVDIKGDNIIFGHTLHDTENAKLYFVDSGHPILRAPIDKYIKRLEDVTHSFGVDGSMVDTLRNIMHEADEVR